MKKDNGIPQDAKQKALLSAETMEGLQITGKNCFVFS